MLKIKDNVDLKELEKFGFYKPQKDIYKEYVVMTNEKNNSSNHISICRYDENTYCVELYESGFGYETGVDILYDLIKAGLIEKEEVFLEKV